MLLLCSNILLSSEVSVSCLEAKVRKILLIHCRKLTFSWETAKPLQGLCLLHSYRPGNPQRAHA